MAEDHPIKSLMQTAMESIKEMVDVNTVIGDPVETPDGTVIIPITRVSCGFAAGGGEYQQAQGNSGGNKEDSGLPFGGGSGAGVSVQPMGFLVVNNDEVRLLPVDSNVMVDRLIDMAPKVMNQIQSILGKQQSKQSDTDQNLQGGV